MPLANLRLPRDLPVSVPSLLVRQRPDIRAAESQVHQASANVGVATANMLPNVTLSASGGSSALALAGLYGPQSAAWSVAASVTGPIFDAGSLFHTKESKVAALEQSSAQYRSTVITAFQNVADALRAIQSDADLLKAQIEAEKTAAESLKIVPGPVQGRLHHLHFRHQRRTDTAHRTHQPREGAGLALCRHRGAVPVARRRLVGPCR